MNVDAVLLAWFAGLGRAARRALDLGSGVGAVGLSLLHRDRALHVTFADIDPSLVSLAAKNLADNGWGDRGEALTVDARTLAPAGGGFDLVVCNPPYVEPGRGRPPLRAKQARTGELAVFTEAARRVLAARGRACFVYPAAELATLLATARAAGLEPKRLCLVHATGAQPARVALLEAMPAKRGGLVVLPPFIERDANGATPELRRLVGGRRVLGRPVEGGDEL